MGEREQSRAARPAGRVAVCACTYRRPKGLRRLLESWARQRFRGGAGPDVVGVVCDNDAGQTARAVVEDAAGEHPWPLIYTVSTERGIPQARNRAVAAALGQGAAWVAFIDDDEIAGPGWLDALLEVQRRTGAEVVSGPVVPRYADGVPDWVVEGGFFDHPRYAAGSESGDSVAIANTGNVLFSAALVAGEAEPFDPHFALTGGEDTHFFMRMRRAGARIVWADEAVVEEVVPASRGSARWILQRAYRCGTSRVLCERTLEPSWTWMIPRVTKAIGNVGIGGVVLTPSILRGRAGVTRALRMISYGAGELAGLLGGRYEEYRTTHGE